jgi:hypothetical protein
MIKLSIVLFCPVACYLNEIPLNRSRSPGTVEGKARCTERSSESCATNSLTIGCKANVAEQAASHVPRSSYHA